MPSPDHFEVKCPCCSAVLVLDRRSGKVIETRTPVLPKDESTGDRFEDARKRVETAGERIDEKVQAAKAAEKSRLSKLDALFKERSKEIVEKGEPIERPDGLFDRD
jgi:GTP1/Obg family GTP-binding protein